MKKTEDINILENVQRRAVWWITGSTWDHTAHQWTKSYEQCLAELELPTLSQCRLFLINYQVFKIIYGMDCTPCFSYFTFCKNQRSRRYHPLRLQCASSRLNCFCYSFFVNSTFVWHNLPAYMLCICCPVSFRESLATYCYA